MQPATLKKPTGVFFLAFLFMLAPLGNLLLSFAASGVPGWYEIPVLKAFLQTVSPLDWFWLSLLFITGILLLKPHKTTWTLAIVSLCFVLTINCYRFFTKDFAPDSTLVQWQLVLSSILTFTILILALYFRFPYLDRRAQWLFPTAHRYSFRTPVDVVAQDIFQGVTESISVSGARVRLQRDLEGGSRNLRFVDVIFPEVRNVKIKARVVEYEDNVLRLKFKELRRLEKGYLQDWFRSQLETEQETSS
ncbi:PilZ domain-containing protein [Bdellovibrio bacteriovorus]|uniref:PilZ domain-containing protein n=1 Tax=Bdellovibrio bacteriovorus TaxID=959 RepID=UPI0035A5C658